MATLWVVSVPVTRSKCSTMLTRLLVTTFLFWSEARSGSMPMQKVVPTPTPTPQDVYAKCTESEERFCQRGSDRFHHCTSVTSNTLDPGAPKIVCECQGGFTTPLFQAYEEAFLPSQQCIPCQEEKTVYYGFNLKVRSIHHLLYGNFQFQFLFHTRSQSQWTSRFQGEWRNIWLLDV